MFFSLTPVMIACNQHGLPRFQRDLILSGFASGGSSYT